MVTPPPPDLFTPSGSNETSSLLLESAQHRVSPSAAIGTSFEADDNNNDDDAVTAQATSSSLPLYQLALLGSLTTFIADAAMHPLDSIKTVQQSHLGIDWNIAQAFSYLWDHNALYHGFGTYVTADAIAGACKFGAYETLVGAAIPVPVAAGLAFLASSIPLVPGEFLKQQLQMGYWDVHSLSGLGDAVGNLVATKGWMTLYTGYDAVLLRDVPYTMLELGIYHWCTTNCPAWPTLLSAAVTGAVTACLTTPLDTIKTQIMVGDLDAWSDVWSLEHPWGLWAGLAARVAWIVPFTMIYLPTYDGLKGWLEARQQASTSS